MPRRGAPGGAFSSKFHGFNRTVLAICVGIACASVVAMRTLSNETLASITSTIVAAAIEVHRALGPGLLEGAYRRCLQCELSLGGLSVEAEKAIPLRYRSVDISCAYRVDLIVEGVVLVEVKALDALAPIHARQLYTYLRLARSPVGLLLNFRAPTMRAGIKRVVNKCPERSTS